MGNWGSIGNLRDDVLTFTLSIAQMINPSIILLPHESIYLFLFLGSFLFLIGNKGNLFGEKKKKKER